MTSCTSPRPSAMTFPISEVTTRPSSSFVRRKIRAASRSNSPRRGAGVFFHLSKAPFAARTAAWRSSFVAFGNVARISPVAGLRVSKRLPSDFLHAPPMNRPYSWTIVLADERKARLGYDLIVGAARVLMDIALHDRPGRGEQVARDDVGRPRANLRGEALAPRRRPDPGGPAAEGAARLHVERFVADHPGRPRSSSEVPRGREQHARPRLATRAIRQHVVRTVVHLGDADARLLEPRNHRRMDPGELSFREQLPAGGILVRHNHEPPTVLLEQPHPIDRARQELELVRRPHVPGPPVVDYPVPVEERRRPAPRRWPGHSVAPHAQRATRLRRPDEEVDESPLRERVAGQRHRFVHREPADVFDLVRLQAESLRGDVAPVYESERVGRLAREPRDEDVQQSVEADVDADLLLRLPLHANLGALAVIHEATRDVPMALREPPDRLDHQHARALRQDDLGHAPDHRRVDRPLDERIDVRPLEDGVTAEPLLRVVVEDGLAPQYVVPAEVHHAVRLRPKGQPLPGMREAVLPAVPHEVHLPVRLDVQVFFRPPMGHPPLAGPQPLLMLADLCILAPRPPNARIPTRYRARPTSCTGTSGRRPGPSP